MSEVTASHMPDWDQRLSAAVTRLLIRSVLYVAVGLVWFVSGFALTPLGPGLVYESWHLLVERPPTDDVSLVVDRSLDDGEKNYYTRFTFKAVRQGRVRIWADAGGKPVYYATMLEFVSEADATEAIRNAKVSPISVGGDVSLESRSDAKGRVWGLSLTSNGEGPYYVQKSGYLFLLEAEGNEQDRQEAVTQWKRQQEDRVPFSSALSLVLPGWVHTSALVSGWLATVVAWYAAVSNITAPLRYGIARLQWLRGDPTVLQAFAPPPLPERPAHMVSVRDRVRRRRVRAIVGGTVRALAYLLVILCALRWWWSIGPLPVAPFLLVASVVLVRLGDRVAGSKRRRVSRLRMVKAARFRDCVGAVLWLTLALLVLLYALTWAPGFTTSMTDITAQSARSYISDYRWPALVLLPVSAWALRRGRRRLELTAAQATQDDLRAPVLYLRSFADDKLIVRSHASSRQGLVTRYTYRWWEPFEEVVAWQLWTYGPVVAAAEPGALQAPLGAAREELDDSVDSVWRERVAHRVEQAGLIVVLVGRTQGLAWELECLYRSGRLDRTIFLLPPTTQRGNNRRWEETRLIFDTLGERLPRLPRGSEKVIAASITAEGVVFAVAPSQSDWSYEAALEALVEHLREPSRRMDVRGGTSP
ncbi:hypothetical protein AB0M44_43310 [Streptosporangium subroseum]|uniref:hypothetical protein n=1 Tax=Streptosporangium subroseum TaxID=106412 RepID=UPI003441BBB1